MNLISFEITISKNKRARLVVENNRFVLAGQELSQFLTPYTQKEFLRNLYSCFFKNVTARK